MNNIKENDRRISIVLNGKEKTYEELEKDKQAYEEVLNQEIAATKEEEPSDDFPWLLNENSKVEPTKVVDLGARRRDKKKLEAPFWDDGKSENSPKLPHIKRKKKKRFQFNFKELPLGLLGIIFSAIIVGVSFGFMMLTIFTGAKTPPQVVANPNSIQAPTPVEVPAVAMQGEIPILGVEIVQGGAFSTAEKGQETATSLQENGFAAALTNTQDPVYLFIGLGLDREQARVIGEHYQSNGQEIYLKPYAVSATGVVEKEEQSLFLQTGVDFYQQLTLLSVNGFANGGSLLTEDMLADVKNIQEKFLSVGDPFSDSEIQQPLAIAFQGTMTSAYQSIESYATTRSEADLWQVQQYLLNGLIIYEQLISTF